MTAPDGRIETAPADARRIAPRCRMPVARVRAGSGRRRHGRLAGAPA